MSGVNFQHSLQWASGKSLIALVALCVMFTSGCEWIQGHVDDSEVKQLDDQMAAFKRETIMDQALVNLGKMLQAYDVPPTPIQSQNIGNETADKGVPTNLYVMVSTAVNKIGNEVIFIPYDTQYIVNESITGGSIKRIYPDAVISGGITGVEKDLIQKEREGDASAGWMSASGSARYNAAQGTSRITLDLNMRNYTTQAFFPGVLASNAIVIRQDRLGWGVSASYMDFSVSFDSEVKTKQGIYAALRFLVELSTVELLGKYFAVPYWKCIDGASEDRNMVQRLKENIESMPSGRQIRYIKKYLYLSGFTGIDRASEALTPAEQAVFSSQMRKFDVTDYPSLFISVWENLPMDKALEIKSKDRKKEMREQKAKQEDDMKRAAQQQKEAAQKQADMQKQSLAAKQQYEALINKADKLYTSGDLTGASEVYQEALTLVPNDKYAMAQLSRTKSLIESVSANEAAYREAVGNADKAFSSEDYDAALQCYQKALSLKPGDAYSLGMIAKTEKIQSAKGPTGIKQISSDEWSSDGNN